MFECCYITIREPVVLCKVTVEDPTLRCVLPTSVRQIHWLCPSKYRRPSLFADCFSWSWFYPQHRVFEGYQYPVVGSHIRSLLRQLSIRTLNYPSDHASTLHDGLPKVTQSSAVELEGCCTQQCARDSVCYSVESLHSAVAPLVRSWCVSANVSLELRCKAMKEFFAVALPIGALKTAMATKTSYGPSAPFEIVVSLRHTFSDETSRLDHWQSEASTYEMCVLVATSAKTIKAPSCARYVRQPMCTFLIL